MKIKHFNELRCAKKNQSIWFILEDFTSTFTTTLKNFQYNSDTRFLLLQFVDRWLPLSFDYMVEMALLLLNVVLISRLI